MPDSGTSLATCFACHFKLKVMRNLGSTLFFGFFFTFFLKLATKLRSQSHSHRPCWQLWLIGKNGNSHIVCWLSLDKIDPKKGPISKNFLCFCWLLAANQTPCRSATWQSAKQTENKLRMSDFKVKVALYCCNRPAPNKRFNFYFKAKWFLLPVCIALHCSTTTCRCLSCKLPPTTAIC